MIEITEKAAEQILKLKSEDPSASEDSFLRVKVVPGGCSGLSYKMNFDNQTLDNDKIFEKNGCVIGVDSKSYLHIVGMTLDFSGGLNGKGFTFSNPSATKTCGCGSSFAV